MAIAFMVLGGPRSATTWLANLLTTDATLCMHDPLIEHTNRALEQMVIPGKRLGIADTAAILFPEWLAYHPSRKILLWREPAEVNASIRALGLSEIDPVKHATRISKLKGVKMYPWRSVFQPAVAYEICRYFDVPFCRYRFEELKKMNVQPHFASLPIGREAAQEMVRRLAKEIE